MRRRAFYFVGIIFAMQSIVALAQTAERTRPGFSLSIEAADVSHLSVGYPSGYHKLLVTYTNISDADESYSNNDPAEMFDMHVLLEGAPAKETDNMRRLREERNHGLADPSTRRTIWAPSVRQPRTIKHGEGFTFALEISYFFDMTKPGTYTISVSKETFPWNPEKSVTVKSNTITIVVPKPEATND
jgi:hypothetical protein